MASVNRNECLVTTKITQTKRGPEKFPYIINDVPSLDCSEKIADDFEGLFETMKFSDVLINVQEHAFSAHKSILSARSPVLAAMFDHPTSENLSNQIDIEDIKPEVFKEILRYIYTTRVKQIQDIACELLVAADKYLLVTLKTKCEKALLQTICTTNCAELLWLSDRYSLNSLKAKALDFFHQHPSKVLATDSWKTMKKDHPSFCCDILERIIDLIPTPRTASEIKLEALFKNL